MNLNIKKYENHMREIRDYLEMKLEASADHRSICCYIIDTPVVCLSKWFSAHLQEL